MKLFFVLGLLAMPACAADLLLLQNGKSDYQIVVPEAAASPAISNALAQTARLLQTAFKANGADPASVTEAKRAASKPAWYRTTVTLPAGWQGRGLRLLFGSVDEQAWVYVNGQLVREHTEQSEKKSFNDLWEMPFIADVPPALLKPGQPNVVAVRVLNTVANGGLWRPVLVQGLAGK